MVGFFLFELTAYKPDMLHDHRVDLSEQVEEILAGVQAKSTFLVSSL
jgi:hypothetical protein